jgi:arginyl-tRNA synthetase
MAEKAAQVTNNMDIKKEIENIIHEALKSMRIEAPAIVLEHPSDSKMGDYSTNIAMALAKSQGMNPKELAEKIKDLAALPPSVAKIEVAGPGFINFYLSRDFYSNSVKEILEKKEDWGKNELSKGKKVMVEYTDPNPFKPFHIGHLMTNAIGESIARIFEFSSAETVRANYQGDVGLHVAKAIWALKKEGLPDQSLSVAEQASYIGECYAKGSSAHENDPAAKVEIDEINKKVYDRSDPEINNVYDWGKITTLNAFEDIYKLLGTKFVHYFFESEIALKGIDIVKENTGKVFKESDGAIVFKAEEHDPKLHTRVFITSKGLPTYEAKELGLSVTKFEKESNLDLSIVVTAIEQGEYMKVVQKAISLMYPELEEKMKHITHGMMRFANGKMSSRKGNVVTGESLIRDSMDLVREKVKDRELADSEKDEIVRTVGVAALKYSILKSSIGSDIIYDQEKSVSFEGDSGPYLQYTFVRARSILRKAETLDISIGYNDLPTEVSILEQMLYQFEEVVERSFRDLEPHHIATYLTELASSFNSFYANTIVLDTEGQYSAYRLAIVCAFYQTMKNGLYLLGISAPEKM